MLSACQGDLKMIEIGMQWRRWWSAKFRGISWAL